MSLIDELMESCVIVDKTTKPSEYGGIETVWVDGAPFTAAIVFDSSVPAKVAAVQGVTDLYTITTRKDVVLQANDVFRRLKDGKTFMVTTDGKDKHTPASASLNMRVVSAREWVIPNG